MTASERALSFIKKNRFAITSEVAAELGMTVQNANSVLISLSRQNKVRSCPGDKPRSREWFIPSDPGDDTRALVDRAKLFSGPFGILIAQVMT